MFYNIVDNIWLNVPDYLNLFVLFSDKISAMNYNQ